jgi:hypothetical protein
MNENLGTTEDAEHAEEKCLSFSAYFGVFGGYKVFRFPELNANRTG